MVIAAIAAVLVVAAVVLVVTIKRPAVPVPSTSTISPPPISTTSTPSKSNATQLLLDEFNYGVSDWNQWACIYHNYSAADALSAINQSYVINLYYNIQYENTKNITYELAYPGLIHGYLTAKYPQCSLSLSLNESLHEVSGALSEINKTASALGIPSNELGTPLFVIFNNSTGTFTYVIGATPNAINSTLNVLHGGGTKASAAQLSLLRGLARSEYSLYFSRGSNTTVIEMLDPVCPFCAAFYYQYGGEMESLPVNLLFLYFPTHVMDYYYSALQG
ncbi:hypothetical protein GCM10007981_18920 [Thermocladium modestius]|uniref:Uncharacterized protein n=1 Tax=Thermocladium modestius TaxID=62609 RepID=A0A830GVV1_9CREN|nr:hypothetical protein GCM10007981_18920 [Thermocladium modestius]